ncbi:DUF397 domain-containing protein [Streptomyces sp. NPDC048001]|uniref:DUF397 domain-containing protein n=1 Tax=unclassified Streptomyces TaxID=2593676 RepID=UPI00371ED135
MKGPRPAPTAAVWHRSSYSNQEGGDCVEVAHGTPGTVPVRDSKNPDRPNLTFHTAPWTTFLTHLKSGRGAVDRG